MFRIHHEAAAPGGGGGEANTASNEGVGGVGLFKQKSGVNLQFKSINAASGKVTITDDTGNNEVDIDLGQLIYFTEQDNGNSGTADTIDWTTGNKQKSTLTDNCTFTFTAPTGPCNILLRLVQDATGSRTVTWPATVKWPGGTAPTLTTTANAIDIVTFYYDGTNYNGVANLDFS